MFNCQRPYKHALDSPPREKQPSQSFTLKGLTPMNNDPSRSKAKKWLLVIGVLLVLIGLLHLVTKTYREEEKQLRSQLRKSIKESFPEKHNAYLQTIGLSYVNDNIGKPSGAALDRKAVVLVHGLDDPGKVWNVLAPKLVKEGLNVWLMNYPNDQPIVESSRLLLSELERLRNDGIQHLSLIAHSMGGLVSREMLTNTTINYATLIANGQAPRIQHLIMVGTPNHGSQLARFRVLAEFRDQLARLQKGQAGLMDFILDGAGEAKIDLLPGSRFLTELNSRPHPQGVDQLVIAGVTSPWKESDIKRWRSESDPNKAVDQQQEIDALGQYMISMVNGLGDGLVTVESTRMEGVDHRTVDGTHLSMIRNITQDSQRIPPAVPLIVDRLKKEDS